MTLDFYSFSSYNLNIKSKGDKKMKNNLKKIIALFSAASLLFLGACSDKPVNGTDFKNQTAEVMVDDFTAEFIFGENGLVEKEKKFYDNQEITYEYYECYEYNEKDQITKRYATDLEGNILEKHDLFEMSYNENGGINKITNKEFLYNFVYNGDGSLKGYTKYEGTQIISAVYYEYDENGNKVKEVTRNAENEATSETVYTYNEKGLVVSGETVSGKTINSKGNVTNEVAYEYDENGLVTKFTRTKQKETRTTVYEYKDGVLVKETMTVASSANSDRDISRSYVTTYEYFANGNVVKFSRARDGEVYITDAYSIDEAKGNFADFDNIISL